MWFNKNNIYMEDLSLKLKKSVIDKLTRNEQNLDIPYLVRNQKSYTRRELASEIENETELGIDTLTSMLILAIDLTARHKE